MLPESGRHFGAYLLSKLCNQGLVQRLTHYRRSRGRDHVFVWGGGFGSSSHDVALLHPCILAREAKRPSRQTEEPMGPSAHGVRTSRMPSS